jgi:hypothetical protein
MMLLEPDRNQLEIFVEALFRHVSKDKDGWISMRAFYEDDKAAKPARITPTSLAGGLRFVIDVAEDDARRAANEPKATVFCPPIAVFRDKDHAREEDLLAGPALTVECDRNPQQARIQLEQILGPATLVVRSGGQWTDPTTQQVHDKIHLHWRLKSVAKGADLAKLKQARQLATRLVDGDASNVPACHPIRWPGSWHRKGTPRLCEIIEQHCDNEIDLDVALPKLLKIAPPPPPQLESGGGQDKLDWDESFHDIVSGKVYHPALTSLSASFARYGVPELAARKTLHALMAVSDPADPERRRRRDVERGKLRSTVHSAYQKFATAPSSALLDPWAEIKMPDFPLDTLPASIRTFIEDQGRIMGGCPNALTLAALCTISGATDHRFKVKMMRHGRWWEGPRLWGLLVGDPSKKKTPIINAATRPLEQRQSEIYRDYKTQLRDYIEAGGKAAIRTHPQSRHTTSSTTQPSKRWARFLSAHPPGCWSSAMRFPAGSAEWKSMPAPHAPPIAHSGCKPSTVVVMPTTVSVAAKSISPTCQSASSAAFNQPGLPSCKD